MPEVILEELYFQRITAFKKAYEKFEDKYKRLKHSITGSMPINNIEDTALAEKEKYKSSSLLKILKLSTNKEILDELITDALEKKAPFDKTCEGKKTDAGFKDALIWKTILYSEEINQCDKVYFFSCDKVFKEFQKPLEEEFKKYHPCVECKIKYYDPDGNQRNLALELMIKENDLIKTNIIKLYNKGVILNLIKNLKYENKQEVIMQGITSNGNNIFLKDILFKSFTDKDFIIKEVEKKEKNYEVDIYLKTRKYTTTSKLFGFMEKRYLFGKIKFVLESKEEDFKVIDSCLLDIKFIKTPMEKMISVIEEQKQIFEHENANLQAFNNVSFIEPQFQQFKEILFPFRNIINYEGDTKENNEKDDENDIY